MSCNKVIYPTKLDALLAIMNAERYNHRERKRSEKILPLRTYYCDKCAGWHLTSMSIEKYNNKRKEFYKMRDVKIVTVQLIKTKLNKSNNELKMRLYPKNYDYLFDKYLNIKDGSIVYVKNKDGKIMSAVVMKTVSLNDNIDINELPTGHIILVSSSLTPNATNKWQTINKKWWKQILNLKQQIKK